MINEFQMTFLFKTKLEKGKCKKEFFYVIFEVGNEPFFLLKNEKEAKIYEKLSNRSVI